VLDDASAAFDSNETQNGLEGQGTTRVDLHIHRIYGDNASVYS